MNTEYTGSTGSGSTETCAVFDNSSVICYVLLICGRCLSKTLLQDRKHITAMIRLVLWEKFTTQHMVMIRCKNTVSIMVRVSIRTHWVLNFSRSSSWACSLDLARP